MNSAIMNKLSEKRNRNSSTVQTVRSTEKTQTELVLRLFPLNAQRPVWIFANDIGDSF